ncbi:tetratricopeptide repeat protein [Candidatus Daviesbacteria bacterium]|nr:tetratricopeptide repeat protein [Candidatus Daviesbacteria bacterium]
MDPTESQNLAKLAIDAALDCRWDDALKLNKQILKLDCTNADTLNRLARVYMEMGKNNLAKKYYSEVIKIDPYNPIALKNLKIIKSFKPGGKKDDFIVHTSGTTKLSASLFLQEPGKTKIVSLLKVAEPQKLSKAYCGMQVMILIKNRKITIIDANENYLGVLPDDISHHLLRLLRGGNKYDLFIKSVKVNGLAVLIKETYRSKRFKNQPSFLENSDATLTTDLLTPLDNQNDEEQETENEDEQTA